MVLRQKYTKCRCYHLICSHKIAVAPSDAVALPSAKVSTPALTVTDTLDGTNGENRVDTAAIFEHGH